MIFLRGRGREGKGSLPFFYKNTSIYSICVVYVVCSIDTVRIFSWMFVRDSLFFTFFVAVSFFVAFVAAFLLRFFLFSSGNVGKRLRRAG